MLYPACDRIQGISFVANSLHIRKRKLLYQELAQRFNELLELKQPPIGLAFVETVPEDIQHSGQRVPSACTFWRQAEQGVFYATADDHQNCPIGMMTMG